MNTVRNRQRLAALRIYRNRILNWNRTNSPFLSGDGFADLCDVSVFPPNYRGIKPRVSDISRAQSIFCPSDKLDLLIETYGDAINARLLVLGNSDRDFLEPLSLPDSIEKVFLQNSYISNEKYRTLPIGIENLRWGKNGFKGLFSDSYPQVTKKDAILVGPFSPTHPERDELGLWKNIKDSKLFIGKEYLKPSELAILSSKYRFVACPRGNGTDTHRFWEALYRGSIPVVKESRWSNSIRDLGLPILELREWDYEEFLRKSKDFNIEYSNPKLLPILWLDYWNTQFKVLS
jgi:hypothetical protein